MNKDLLNEKRQKTRQIRQFKRMLKKACKEVNKVLDDARCIWPDATLYLSGSEMLHLLSGPSHDGDGIAHQDRIIVSADLLASGGDW